jgi:hypothetical protein
VGGKWRLTLNISGTEIKAPKFNCPSSRRKHNRTDSPPLNYIISSKNCRCNVGTRMERQLKVFTTVAMEERWMVIRLTQFIPRDMRFLQRRCRCCYSGLWRNVDSQVDISVSEKHTVSTFRAVLKIETVCFSETLVSTYLHVYTASQPRTTTSTFYSLSVIHSWKSKHFLRKHWFM